MKPKTIEDQIDEIAARVNESQANILAELPCAGQQQTAAIYMAQTSIAFLLALIGPVPTRRIVDNAMRNSSTAPNATKPKAH